jgi:hypothetical protein
MVAKKGRVGTLSREGLGRKSITPWTYCVYQPLEKRFPRYFQEIQFALHKKALLSLHNTGGT